MKALILASALASLLSGCGNLNPMQPAQASKAQGPCQVAGSTVSILDQIPGCAVIADQIVDAE